MNPRVGGIDVELSEFAIVTLPMESPSSSLLRCDALLAPVLDDLFSTAYAGGLAATAVLLPTPTPNANGEAKAGVWPMPAPAKEAKQRLLGFAANNLNAHNVRTVCEVTWRDVM